MKKSKKILVLLMCLLMVPASSVSAASADDSTSRAASAEEGTVRTASAEESTLSQKFAEHVSKIQNVVEGEFTETVMYTTVRLNFREGPSKESRVQKVLPKNQEVVQLEKEDADGWCKISCDEMIGYVKAKYLSDTNPMENLEYLGNYYITGYCMFDASENGGRSDGLTASGVVGQPWHTVAMKGIDFGTEIYIDGLGFFVVEDRGVGLECVDVAVNSTSEAYALTGYSDVYIVK